MGPLYLPRPTEETWVKNEKGFREKWNYPNCCGAVDGKHIRIEAPSQAGSVYYNYKGYHSIVLMAVTGPNYTFSAVDIGASGSQSDGGVFSRSSIGKALENGSLLLPPAKPVGSTILPHVFVADDAFPLKTNIMKPFPGKFLEIQRRIFNYRLSRARMVVENSFGVLAARWRIFGTTINADIELVKSIVEASVILHNFLIQKQDMNLLTFDTDRNGQTVSGNWRQITENDNGMRTVGHQGSNNYTGSASSVRESFMQYFNSEDGSVSWQNDKI